MLLASTAYSLIIVGAVIIILSYFFNILARKTNVPSVLMLIVLGMLITGVLNYMGVSERDWLGTLEVLGTVGLVMIVLEAALELELTKDKWPIIWKSFVIALLALIVSTLLVAMVINFFVIQDVFRAVLYAIPISIMSSAIIIPSVGNLVDEKKEFMVYESTFSDILGIMFFYFLLDNAEASDAGTVAVKVIGNIILTVVLSVVLSYALVWVFQRLKTQLKLFLLIAVLMLLYAVGKKLEFSSLVIILVFGLMVNNHKLFFRGVFKQLVNADALKPVLHDLHLVTLETAFVVRTFFFVIFGISISLASLIDIYVAFVSAIIILALYGARLAVLRLFKGRDVLPELYIAPRGLITILLFYAIPHEYQSDKFDNGILLYSIIVTSVVMTWALIADARARTKTIEVAPEEVGHHAPVLENNEDAGPVGAFDGVAAAETTSDLDADTEPQSDEPGKDEEPPAEPEVPENKP